MSLYAAQYASRVGCQILPFVVLIFSRLAVDVIKSRILLLELYPANYIYTVSSEKTDPLDVVQ